jgi:glutamine synthetase
MLPVSLESATERMMHPDSVAREDSVFGNDFVDHFGGTRQHEIRVWNEAVTNWEGECHNLHVTSLTVTRILVERYLELA